jgi:hypothetical protein
MNELDLIARLDDSSPPDDATLARALDRLLAGIAAQPDALDDPTPADATDEIGGARDSGEPRHRDVRSILRRRRALMAAAGGFAAAAAAALVVVLAIGQTPTTTRNADAPLPAAPLIGTALIGTALIGTAASGAGPASGGGVTHPTPMDPQSTGGVLSTPAPPPPTNLPAAAGDAAVVLAAAAAAARSAPAQAPRADQFLYISNSGGYEAWFSIDGTQDGRIDDGRTSTVPGCRDGVQQVAGNYTGTRPVPCSPQPAFLADAPTTAQAMADYIVGRSGGGSANVNGAAKAAMAIAEFNYLLPAAKAALFEALPLLPGLQLDSGTTIVDGTAAIAVSWQFEGSTSSLLFDAATHEYLGCSTSSPGTAGGPTGPQSEPTPVGGPTPGVTTFAPPGPASALVVFHQAVVDAVGQRG